MLDSNELGDVRSLSRVSARMTRSERDLHVIKMMPPPMRMSFGCVPVYFNFFGRVAGANMSEWLLGFPEVDHPDLLPVLRRFVLFWQNNLDATLDVVEMSIMGRRHQRPSLLWVQAKGKVVPLA